MKERGADVEKNGTESYHKSGTAETQDSEENDKATVAAAPNHQPTIEFVGFSSLSRQEKYDLTGWVLFIFSAIFYLVAAVEFESLTSLLGSIFFLVACFAFLIPMLWKEKQS